MHNLVDQTGTLVYDVLLPLLHQRILSFVSSHAGLPASGMESTCFDPVAAFQHLAAAVWG
jgi:hypothetical protein